MARNPLKAAKRTLLTLAALAVPGAALAGQGFYLGIEGGANFLKDQKFKLYSFDPPLGIGAVADGTQISKVGFDTNYIGGLLTGYAFTSGLRMELEVARRHNKFDKIDLIDGSPSQRVEGKENADIAMGNLWLDFFPSGWVHPYIGGGIGAARIDIRDPGVDSVGLFASGSNLQNAFDVVLAYQGGAGLRFDLTKHLTASLDYRYLRSERGKFNLLENNPDSHVETRYQSQAALLSIRYHFGEEHEPAVAPVEPVQIVEVIQPPAPPPPVAPPPPPPCEAPLVGQAMNLQGCKIGDVIVLRGVKFMFDKSVLTLNAKALLDGVAEALTRRPDIKVAILGHTDSKGSDSYNQRLSEQRAQSARQYLIERGIEAGRMLAVGLGETQPIADNTSDEGREENRRVELKVTERGPEGGDPVGVVTP